MPLETLGRPLPPKTGYDVPDKAGSREAGKFRESAYPGLDTIAVGQDDGRAVGTLLIPYLVKLTEAVDRLRIALEMGEVAIDPGPLTDTPSVAPNGHVVER